MSTLHEKAIDYLSRREHSRAELKQKLLLKGFPQEAIDETLDDLIARKFQSDARFAESYVRYRKQAGFGPIRIKLELQERGVASSIIDTCIDEKSFEWFLHMKIVLQKKMMRSANKNQQQQCRFLQQRGFSAEMIYRLMR